MSIFVLTNMVLLRVVANVMKYGSDLFGHPDLPSLGPVWRVTCLMSCRSFLSCRALLCIAHVAMHSFVKSAHVLRTKAHVCMARRCTCAQMSGKI